MKGEETYGNCGGRVCRISNGRGSGCSSSWRGRLGGRAVICSIALGICWYNRDNCLG